MNPIHCCFIFVELDATLTMTMPQRMITIYNRNRRGRRKKILFHFESITRSFCVSNEKWNYIVVLLIFRLTSNKSARAKQEQIHVQSTFTHITQWRNDTCLICILLLCQRPQSPYIKHRSTHTQSDAGEHIKQSQMLWYASVHSFTAQYSANTHFKCEATKRMSSHEPTCRHAA